MMKSLIQAAVLAITTTDVASAVIANPITPTPTLKQVATCSSSTAHWQQKTNINSERKESKKGGRWKSC